MKTLSIADLRFISHTLGALIVAIGFSLFITYGLIPDAEMKFLTEQDIRGNFQSSKERYMEFPEEKKNMAIGILMDSYMQGWEFSYNISKSYFKYVKGVIAFLCYVFFMQLIYVFLLLTTRDVNKSALYHCLVGVCAILYWSVFLGDQSNIDDIDRFIAMILIPIFMIGTLMKSRIIASIWLLFVFADIVFLVFSEGKVSPHVLLIFLLLVDAVFSIFSHHRYVSQGDV